jgi:alpha-glucosidase
VLASDPFSILSLYVKLIDLRKQTPELVYGDYAPEPALGDLLAYRRSYDGQTLLIALNLGASLLAIHVEGGEILLSTQLDRKGENVSGPLELRADEGVIVRLR